TAPVANSPYTTTCSGASQYPSSDYVVTYVPGSITVTPLPVRVTADNKSKVYDGFTYTTGPNAHPFTVTYDDGNGNSPWASGESAANLSGTLSFLNTATTAINPGTGYVIQPTGYTSTPTSNYYPITYVNGALTITSPSITLSKTANPTTYDHVGQSITYTYVVGNSGNATLTGPITVTDDKAATVTCPSGDIAQNGSMTCTATYLITQADLDAGTVT